jgi:hypothetical protein
MMAERDFLLEVDDVFARRRAGMPANAQCGKRETK